MGQKIKELMILTNECEIYSEKPENFTDYPVTHKTISDHFGIRKSDIKGFGRKFTDDTEEWMYL